MLFIYYGLFSLCGKLHAQKPGVIFIFFVHCYGREIWYAMKHKQKNNGGGYADGRKEYC
jgi:hypothetical protein